jgi:hypothetical protein
MPSQVITFDTTSGWYNGSAAIANDTNFFYCDLGKTSGYADGNVSGPDTNDVLASNITVLGIEVFLEDAGYLDTSTNTTVDVALYHVGTSAYTTAETITLTSNAGALTGALKSAGGQTALWGKTWAYSDLQGLRVRIFNPLEPGDGIALASSYLYVTVSYLAGAEPAGHIIIPSGKVSLSGYLRI